MQKLAEVSNRKRRWHMRKRKKAFLLTKGTKHFFSFRQCLSNQQHHFAVWFLGTTHMSLNVASVSPFHPVAAPSRSTLCWNIQDLLLNYKLTLTGLWQNFQKKTNPYGSLKYQMRTPTYMKRINVFLTTLTGGFKHFDVFRKNSLIHGMVVEPSK